jgi:hypothetical protein
MNPDGTFEQLETDRCCQARRVAAFLYGRRVIAVNFRAELAWLLSRWTVGRVVHAGFASRRNMSNAPPRSAAPIDAGQLSLGLGLFRQPRDRTTCSAVVVA